MNEIVKQKEIQIIPPEIKNLLIIKWALQEDWKVTIQRKKLK